MKINIETIPMSEMRYETAGDYWIDKDDTIQFRVAEMGFLYEFLVIIHEMIEFFICKALCINLKSIDKFDIKFEKDRAKGLHTETEEPGDAVNAPYRDPHCLATAAERMLCAYLKIPWQKYDNACNGLEYKPEKKEQLICKVE
jgi:hypothetical protein